MPRPLNSSVAGRRDERRRRRLRRRLGEFRRYLAGETCKFLCELARALLAKFRSVHPAQPRRVPPMDFDCFDDPEDDAPAAAATLAPRATEHPHFRQSHWVWPAAAASSVDTSVPEPPCCTYQRHRAAKAPRTVRAPSAYRPRACRTRRVPCCVLAPQAAAGAPPDEPLGHATRQLLRQRAEACGAALRKARGDAYAGAAAAALLAACAALERDDVRHAGLEPQTIAEDPRQVGYSHV